MRDLTIILESGTPQRMRVAFEMALVQRALGGQATLFVTGAAVAALESPHPARDEALAAGVRIVVCQTALADAGMSLETFDPRIEAGGFVSVMQRLGDERLVVI